MTAVCDQTATSERRVAGVPRPTSSRPPGSAVAVAALEVPLELARDGLTGRLGELGGVARLLQGPDVVGHVLVLLGELVDPALPRPGVLGQVAERDAHLEQ